MNAAFQYSAFNFPTASIIIGLPFMKFHPSQHCASLFEVNTVAEACAWLRKGNLLVYPTETFYALGCASNNSEAMAIIYQIKGRSFAKPLPILAGNEKILHKAVVFTNNIKRLARIYWPGPLTILCKGIANLPPFLRNEQGKTAVRVSANREAATISNNLGLPLISTSANCSGERSVMDLKNFSREFLSRLDTVKGKVAIAAWKSANSLELPSTIIDVQSDGKILILRHGQISESDLCNKNFEIACNFPDN